MSNSEAVISFVKRRKNDLIKVFGGKCCQCGFDKWQSALEFHHVNPESKEFGITTDTTTRAIDKQLAELKKCILVCANCHRGIHSNDLEIPDNWQEFYDDDIAEELKQNVRAKKFFCAVCGKEKSRHGMLCTNCSKESSRVAQRPSREELKTLIRNKTFLQIGFEYNVSNKAICKWCKIMNLPSTKKEIKSFSDEEWAKI